ncbi:MULTISPECIES: Flp family type IVb pilin [Brucella/Ochrobactrum group]|uniref:Flp family type IVb pilin n=1 Tax=Brucella/Ochrobactrum group TaxID=2826938 RepID=UPI00111D3F62|nr:MULTISPECIES: Flp family type IVb pilin [Brucella/Ochrobactrum group]
MPTLMTRFMKNRAGSTAIEYALIGTLVSIMIISGVALVAGNVGEKFNDTATQFEQAINR